MSRVACCLLFASLCLPIIAQEAPQTEQDTVEGWIVGASDRVLRVDPDESWHVIHQVKGLKHLRVIPGTQTAIAAGDDGVFAFRDGRWQSVFTGKWDRLEYSMNYRSLTVQSGNRLHIKQLLPEIGDIEAYADGAGAQDWLPSGRGELALRSGAIRLDPGRPPIKVQADSGGHRLPVEFIASDDESGVQYATIRHENVFWLVRLDTKGRGETPTAPTVVGERAPEPIIVVPLRQEDVLAQLTAKVDRVVPAPSPYLAFLVGERIQWVNTETGQLGFMPVAIGESFQRPLSQAGIMNKLQERRLGLDAWHVASVTPPLVLAVQPATRFNPLALEGSGRACTVTGTEPQLAMVDCVGLVGFGPYHWPTAKPPTPLHAPGIAAAQLEKRELASAEGERAEAVVFVDGRTLAAMPDGGLQERRHSILRQGREYQLSPDHSVLLVNATPAGDNRRFNGTGAPERRGPCYVFRSHGCLTYPAPGDLSADGNRVWFRDTRGLQSYDVDTGDLRVMLGVWSASRDHAIRGFRVDPYAGRALLADEVSQRWVAVLAGRYGSHDGAGVTLRGLYDTPDGGALIFETHKAASGAAGYDVRIRYVPHDHVARSTSDVYRPILSDVLVARGNPLGPHHDAGRAVLKRPGQFRHVLDHVHRVHIAWASGGAYAVMEVEDNRPLLFARHNGFSLTPLPDGYRFVHFSADGEHLLAVVDQRITDATAPEGRQVLVKINLASGQIVWTSEAFANCQGMVPYPAFDLQVFHDATGSGL